MQLLDNQSKTIVIKKKDLEYIEQYRKIYRRVIQEAKRRENNNRISSAKNKSKAAWLVINKELGKFVIDNQQDANFLVYLFVPNQLCMFRVMFSPTIRST